jgi:hypothetical protein
MKERKMIPTKFDAAYLEYIMGEMATYQRTGKISDATLAQIQEVVEHFKDQIFAEAKKILTDATDVISADQKKMFGTFYVVDIKRTPIALAWFDEANKFHMKILEDHSTLSRRVN